MTPHVLLSVGLLVCPLVGSVGQSVCHNFQKKNQEVIQPCSYRRTCLSTQEPKNAVNREETCPLLLRVFCSTSRHNSMQDYSKGLASLFPFLTRNKVLVHRKPCYKPSPLKRVLSARLSGEQTDLLTK